MQQGLSGITASLSHMDDHDMVFETASPEKMKEVKESREWGKRMELAGTVLAAPAFGLIACIEQIRNLPNDWDPSDLKSRIEVAFERKKEMLKALDDEIKNR